MSKRSAEESWYQGTTEVAGVIPVPKENRSRRISKADSIY